MKTGCSLDRIRIIGGRTLNGVIRISGAKNAALPLMIASLLTTRNADPRKRPESRRRWHAVAHSRSSWRRSFDRWKAAGPPPHASRAIHLSAREIVDTMAPYELVSKMRASFWVIAPLLARMGEAKVSLPGGCAIGTRPVDLLIMALEKLGAHVEIEAGYVHATARQGTHRRRDPFSQGDGRRHPYRADGGFARQWPYAYRQCGARAGDRRSCRLPQQDGREDQGGRAVRGRDRGRRQPLWRAPRVLPDRIEAGTYAMAVAMAGGDVMLEGASPGLCKARSTRSNTPAPKCRRHQRGHQGAPQRGRADGRSTSPPRRFPAFRPICRPNSWP